ncbi:amidohydrolase family protein [Ramlibacter sp. AN1133]|uniref:amidohydrolase family protein n=1 Tax=Ramlibacter sp. AN1133 TaxID=3133429 RepID=UPI0030C24053
MSIPGTEGPRLAVIVDQFFDGDRLYRERRTLRVIEGRIDSVTPGDHTDALAAEGWTIERGGFLMPGMVDAHVHLFLDGACTDSAQRAAHLKRPVEQLTEGARVHAREARAWGVTLLRDAGDRHGINHQIRREAAPAGSGMARVRSVGRGIRRAHGYGAFMAADAGDGVALPTLVEQLARSNDEIKLVLTGIVDFEAGDAADAPQFTHTEAALVVQAAHRCGRKVMAHCSGPRGLDIALAAGVDSVEHGYFVDRAMLSRMRDHDVAWTPTFCPVHFQWAHPGVARWPAATVDSMRRALDAHAEHLRVACELGVRVLVGTDAGCMGVQHGRSVLEEMWHFLDAGMPLEAVLRAATGTPRRHFGAAHSRLVPGAPFEAALFQAPPFADARGLNRPHRVWVGP